jgi:predicted ABC-type transport system involved in lysophospholipase L1 biosynthesis ATPase subunit
VPPELRRLLHDHTGFMQTRLESFVGREAELAEVRRRVAELLPTGGYITVTGQAGQGKSCLIARLVELELRERVGDADQAGKRDWTIHFVDSTVVRAHQHAAGAKRGTLRPKLLAVVEVVSAPS